MMQHQHKQRVAVGMSGGVDSSLTAHLLVEQGYDVVGVFLECWRAPGCRTDEDRKDALRVALELGIPFQVLDFKDAYHQKVVEYFFQEYEAGRTPNPDIMCNKEIKFGLFYDWAIKEGFEFVATGHYADVSSVPFPHNLEKSASLQELALTVPVDDWKDQTYFLHQLKKEQLSHILFPLGQHTKHQVRQEATKRGIHVANKPDSVGICFIGDIDTNTFLKDRLGEKPGDVIDVHGNVIGSHRGMWFYTIGQRHGFTVHPSTSVENSEGVVVERTNLPPFYVIGKNAQKNELIVGFGAETMSDTFEVSNLHLINEIDLGDVNLGEFGDLSVRIRHTGQLLRCTIKNNNGTMLVRLHAPTRGVAEGQSAVFYLDNGTQKICLGGGEISGTSITE